MKRLLRAMWYALLPLIVMFVILIVMHGIKWGCEALGLGEITSIFLAILFFDLCIVSCCIL